MKYLLILIGLAFISCKKDSKIQEEPLNTSKEVYLDFPDTTYVGTNIFGSIEYHSQLDTIVLKKGDRRYIRFYGTITNTKINIQGLKQMKLDTFVSINDSVIPVYDIKFKNLGLNYLDGYVEEVVVLNKFKDTLSRIITNETRVTKNILVVDSTTIIKTRIKESIKGNI